MIRKQNSQFSTAFVSEADKSIKNTDSFAYVELDELACYVLADGIEEQFGAKAARLCVDSVISDFTQYPSMKKRALKRYASVANKVLQKESGINKLKASVIIIVHNYVKMRYLLAGNVRLRVYRDGFIKHESIDQSLGMEYVIREKVQKDKLAIHDERHNLQSYIGQKNGFVPYVSRKIKLMQSDSIAFFSRGYWENVDDGELLDVFIDAGTDPQEIANTAEDVLLSKQPNDLGSYSFVTIFVNKTFINPNIRKNIKKAIMISIPVITIIVVISVIFYFKHKSKQEKIALMNDNYLQTIEYILADNYIKAEEKANETIDLAEEIKDIEMKEDATNYLMLAETVIAGDDFLSSKNYESAQNSYLNALDRSRYADNMGKEYIENKLDRTADYMSVYDLIALGDKQVLNIQYNEAEEKYLQAKILSSEIYFEEGRSNAMKALEELYELEEELQKKLQEETNQKVELETQAANFVATGDKSFAAQDYESALVYYTSAAQKYEQLNDIINCESVEKKIDSTKVKLGNSNDKKDEAVEYIKQAEENEAKKDFIEAKKYYLLAKDIYARLKDDEKVNILTNKIDFLDVEQDKKNIEEEKQKELEEKLKEEEKQKELENRLKETEEKQKELEDKLKESEQDVEKLEGGDTDGIL